MISSMYTAYICEEVQQGRFSSFEEGLRHYKTLGLKTAQVSDEFKHMPDMTATELKEIFDRVGIDPVCHTVVCSVAAADPKRYEEGLADLRKCVEEAHILGCSMIMVVPDPADIHDLSEKPEAAERIIKTLNMICDEAEPLGITVTIENFSSQKAPFQTPEECLHILKNVPKLKFVFDTGNFYWPKTDILAAWDELKEYTIHVHVKDWTLVDKETGIPAPNDEYLCSVCPGKGVTQTAAFLELIKKDGFKGSLVAEYNGFKPLETELDEMMEYYKKFA